MIQPNELRLGNYVLGESSYGDLLIQINGITCTSIHGVASISGLSVSGMTADEVKPIPLSEEILLKCGFENFGFGIFNIPTSDSCDEFFSIQGGFCFLTDCVFNTKKVEYLHQLQNIIFDLYGKELEVKL